MRESNTLLFLEISYQEIFNFSIKLTSNIVSQPTGKFYINSQKNDIPFGPFGTGLKIGLLKIKLRHLRIETNL